MTQQQETIIVASGAYVDSQLEVEFGRIPPAFLPLGGLRLYQHQFNNFIDLENTRFIISIPDDYLISDHDVRTLTALRVDIVRVPGGLTLGQSIVYVINIGACAGGTVRILHGDTLLQAVDWNVLDNVSVGNFPDSYNWGEVFTNHGEIVPSSLIDSRVSSNGERCSLTGWFSFSHGLALVQEITRERGDFVKGLLAYAKLFGLRACETEHWFDFGHADTYYQSRRRFTTQRAFNQLNITKRLVIKSSKNAEKIDAEASWYEMCPPAVRLHIPAFIGKKSTNDKSSYSLEYLHLPTLADLFVFGNLNLQVWDHIFSAVDEVLTVFSQEVAPPDTRERVQGLFGKKTFERLAEYSVAGGVDLSSPCRFNGTWLPSLKDIASIAASEIPDASEQMLTLMHGDFCFSNLLYDHRADLLRVIDPRGIDADGLPFRYGDVRYDIAKLYHSVIGRYDHIIAGHYHIQKHGALDFTFSLPSSDYYTSIENLFISRQFSGLQIEQSAAPAICILLFLSMLPLHADRPDRQQALVANSMRLFLKLNSNNKIV